MLCPYGNVEFHFSPVTSTSAIFLPAKLKADHGLVEDPKGDGDVIRASYCPQCYGVILLHDSKSSTDADGKTIPAGNIKERFESFLLPRHRGKKAMATESPAPLVADFHEAAAILDDSPKASAALCRRLLQRVFHEHLGIKKKDLFQEIDEYVATKNPPTELASQMHAVRNVGNCAAHPLADKSVGTIVDVEPGEAEWLLELLDVFLDHVFVEPARTAARKARLNAKLGAVGKPPMK